MKSIPRRRVLSSSTLLPLLLLALLVGATAVISYYNSTTTTTNDGFGGRTSNKDSTFRGRRRLQEEEQQSQSQQPNQQQYNLPASAAEWCTPPILPPLPYDICKDKSKVNSVPLYGGLTNSLKMVLLGTILSFEEDRCFYVDESASELIHRDGDDNNSNNNNNDSSASPLSFINRYFEPIGLPAGGEVVQAAMRSNNVEARDWKVVWSITRNRRMYGQTYNIDSLHYPNMEGHFLKRTMLRRMWRPLPHIRQTTCAGLADHIAGEEFMTFSVRRGDKASEENFSFASVQQYIDMAEQAIPSHFGGRVPTIFVATDDCTAMVEFRTLRPTWRFVSECDKQTQDAAGHAGFALADMKAWSQTDTDAHYAKFFVELYAMATAKYFIGVWYTNVSWWAQFMRDPDRTTFLMLDTPGTSDFALDWN